MGATLKKRPCCSNEWGVDETHTHPPMTPVATTLSSTHVNMQHLLPFVDPVMMLLLILCKKNLRPHEKTGAITDNYQKQNDVT